jgi:hypothetical protein
MSHAMKHAWLGFLLGCGHAASPTLQLHIAESAALTKADCPTLPASIPIYAQVLVNGDATHPCALTVSENANSGAYAVSGACPNISAQPQVSLTLQWYALGPATQKFVLLAESIGTEPIPGDKQTYIAEFVTVKTKGTSTDDSTERDRFNCDRTGVSTCDSSAAPAVVAQDVDTCSNLEELCKDTLFNAQSTHDSCP